MSTKSILISYVGYPVAIHSLLPDNGLANLAASLIAKGHKTVIFDYVTVDIIKRLFPYQYSKSIQTLISKIMDSLKKEISPNPDDLDSFHKLDEEIDKFQQQKVQEIALEINKYVTTHKIDFVGLKLWVGDGLAGSICIAKELKKHNPKLPIFAGGPHVDCFMERIFEATDIFDVLVYGEGEETITMLADYVEGKRELEDIPNLIYKKDGNIITTPIKRIKDLNDIPPPIYDEDIYLSLKGNQKIKVIVLDESRGCPNSCNFCIHPIKSGKQWRKKTPARIVDEMKGIGDKYGIYAFLFAGSNAPPRLKTQIAKEILKRNLKLTYTAFGHVKRSEKEDFKILKSSGCHSIFFGIESGSQEILDKSMNKGIKVNQISEAIKACKEAGLQVVGSIMIPSPLETDETKKDTLNFLLQTRPDFMLITIPSVIPGTKWAKEPKKFGIEIPDKEKFFNEAMKYRMKVTYPHSLWPRFPYFYLNGKSFAQISQEASDFAQILDKNGILTQVTNSVVMLAKFAQIPPREFRDMCRQYLFTGDYSKIGELVKKINKNIQEVN